MTEKKNGTIGKDRDPLLWWVLGFFFYPVQVVWAYVCWEDIKNFTKKDIPSVLYLILMFIPIVNIIILYSLFCHIKEMQETAGVPESEQINPIVVIILMCCFGIGIFMAQGHINNTWEYARK
jgi:hypothetical protein